MNYMDLHRIFDLQYQASRAQVDAPLLVRRERLLRLQVENLETDITPAGARGSNPVDLRGAGREVGLDEQGRAHCNLSVISRRRFR